MSKTCGEWFDLLFDAVPKGTLCPVRARLMAACREATFAENHLWALYRLHDPVTGTEVVRRRAEKERTGVWPKLEKYTLTKTPDGETPTKIARNLCPSLKSVVYDSVAHHVATLYSKRRLALLNHQARIPFADDIRLRFREKAVTIIDLGDDEFGVRMNFWQEGGPVTVKIAARHKSEFTRDWLRDWCGQKEGPSGGTLTRHKKKGKWQWIITFARERRSGERAQVKRAVEGRALCVYAPAEQGDVFLRMVVTPVRGQPWRMSIEANDLIRLKLRHDIWRRQMGAVYSQSRHHGAGMHGHGRERAIWAKMSYADRYDNAVSSWIEKRSAFIVARAVELRCQQVWMQDLTTVDSRQLALGAFQYHRLALRVKQKCADANVEFGVLANIMAKEVGEPLVSRQNVEEECVAV